MKLIISCTFICLASAFCTSGQIAQNHPEMCGKPDSFVSVPPNITAAVDAGGGEAKVFIKTGNSVNTVVIPRVTAEIEEVCPIAGGRVVLMGGAYVTDNIAIIDASTGSLLDSFYGTAPRMSPDQHWLVYRKFYPRGVVLSVSEEYLLYDLTKTRSQNRPPGIADANRDDVGRAIFPLGQKNSIADNIGVSEDQVHSANSHSFFWSPDSKAIVFADSAQGNLSMVLITLDSETSSSAVVSPPIACSDSCSCGRSAMVTKAVVTDPLPDGDRRLRVEFFRCEKTLELRAQDFQPAPVEVHVEPKRKGAVEVVH